MIPLKIFLLGTGATEKDSKTLNNAKSTYRKMYNQSYQRQYRKTRICKSILFTRQELKLLDNAATTHGRKFSTFVREAALAYLDSTFIVPNELQVTALENQIRRIGNNLNQVVHLCHRQSNVFCDDVNALWQNVRELESEVSKTFRSPVIHRPSNDSETDDA